MTQINIVALDGHTLNPGDLSWEAIQALGTLKIYARSTQAEALERAKKADILVLNKFVVSAELIAALPQLKCICVSATGYNNVDITAAKARNIPVCNAVGYSTTSVAQHVFALLLKLTNEVDLHHKSVQAGDWSNCLDFSYSLSPLEELAGKTMGIYGFGRIGQKVANIAHAFDMKILATHKHPERDARPNVDFVSLETLFSKSDAISLHAPLSDANFEIVNKDLLKLMKPSAYLINTGRGALIQELDLRNALQERQLSAAALDVLSVEPPPISHPLIGLSNCIVTPHQAWGSQAARRRLMDITAENIKAFLADSPQNVVNV